MSEETKPGPVDNSSLDAGIAARDSKQEAKTEEVAEQAAEIVEDDLEDEQNESDTEDSAAPEDDADDGAPAKQDKPKRKGVGKRIDELTKEKYDAQRERDHWRQMAEKAQQTESQPAQAPKPDSNAEPTLEDCDFDPTEYQRRFYKWARENEKVQERTQKAQQQYQERVRTVAEKEAAFTAEHPDYDAVARAPNVPITGFMAAAMFEGDDTPAVAYYLGKNLDEAAKIAQMSPIAQAKAIGKIEASLSAPASQRQPEPKTVTNAPAPVTKLSGSPAAKKSYEDMSMREYSAARQKERQAKGLSP